MSCASCARRIETTLKAQEGVGSASVSFAGKSLHLEYDPDTVKVQKLKSVVKKIGYELITEDIEREELAILEQKRYRDLKRKLMVSVILTVPVFVLSMFFHRSFRYENLLILVLTLPVIAWCGREFFVNAYGMLRHFTAGMDTLVALGTGAAFIYSTFTALFPDVLTSGGIVPHVYFESAAVIITLILSGRFLEERARNKALSAIRSLMSLQPKTLTVLRDGEELNIPLTQVVRGDIVLVKPGEKIPVDGKVTCGESYVDESMMTG
jgi:Cu2+-exporting ATPase